ncbi:MAG: septal ring lytic transglycosylase RlpA family protein [Candidatus Competibacteraceae bacterium]
MQEKVLRNALLGTLVLGVFSGCSTAPQRPPGEVAVAPDANTIGGIIIQNEVVPHKEPASIKGNPESYVVFGKRYYVMNSSEGYRQRGIASWYGPGFHGRKTSSGTIYNMYGVSAAHKHLPIPTYARVTNLGNGRSIIVRIDDRGPFVGDRLIDLSYGAAVKLGMMGEGTVPVEVETLPPYQYMPGFEPGQMLAGLDSLPTAGSARAASAFTLPAAPATGNTIVAADLPSTAENQAGSGFNTADARPPAVYTGPKTALATPVRLGGTDVSRTTAFTDQPAALGSNTNKPFTAPPARNVAPVTPAVSDQPGHGDNNSVATTVAPTAKATTPEPTGPADRDSLSFSNRLATVGQQPSSTVVQPLPTAPAMASTPVNPPRLPAGPSPATFTPPTGPTVATFTPSPIKPVVTMNVTSSPTPVVQPSVTVTPPTGPTVAAITPPTAKPTPAPIVTVQSPAPPVQPPVATSLPTVTAVTPPAGMNPRVIAAPVVSSPEPAFNSLSRSLAQAQPTEADEGTDTPVRPRAPRKSRRPAPDDTADSAKAERPAADTPEPKAARAAEKVTTVDKSVAKARATAAVTPEKSTLPAKAPANDRLAAATAKPSAKPDKGQVDKAQAGNQTVAAADSSHLYLQVGAFAQRGNAEELRNRLIKALRYSVRIDPGRNKLHTVRVGPLNDPVEASRLKGRLASFGISTPHVVFE